MDIELWVPIDDISRLACKKKRQRVEFNDKKSSKLLPRYKNVSPSVNKMNRWFIIFCTRLLYSICGDIELWVTTR